MKKHLLVLLLILCAGSVSAQQWAVGLRLGSGVQADVQYTFSSQNYIEGRLGTSWIGAHGMGVDITALYNWNISNMDWTPSAGRWFFDAGVGANFGTGIHYIYTGVAGMAKLGINFKNAPIGLSLDWTPVIGVGIYSGDAAFNGLGFGNFGLTCVYRF